MCFSILKFHDLVDKQGNKTSAFEFLQVHCKLEIPEVYTSSKTEYSFENDKTSSGDRYIVRSLPCGLNLNPDQFDPS